MEDPLHRKFNDMKDDIVHTGWWIRILGHAVVCDGPLGHRRSMDS